MEEPGYSNSGPTNVIDSTNHKEDKNTNLTSTPDAAVSTIKHDLGGTSSFFNDSSEKAQDVLSGFELFAVMLSITLAAFLLLLDASIVSTVSFHTLPLICSAVSR
jgi:hypothetical protein